MPVPRLERISGRGDRARVLPRTVPGRAIRAVIALVVVATHLGACFRHAPADFATVPTGAQLLVTINDRGRTELREVLGPGAERVDGRLLSHTDDEIVLSVTSVRHADLREPVQWSGDAVTIPRDMVGPVQERSLDRNRSWLVGGLLVVGAVIASTISLTGRGGGGNGDNGPPANGEGET